MRQSSCSLGQTWRWKVASPRNRCNSSGLGTGHSTNPRTVSGASHFQSGWSNPGKPPSPNESHTFSLHKSSVSNNLIWTCATYWWVLQFWNKILKKTHLEICGSYKLWQNNSIHAIKVHTDSVQKHSLDNKWIIKAEFEYISFAFPLTPVIRLPEVDKDPFFEHYN